LLTLADNRDLQTQLDEAKQMLTQVDITRFSSYRWGLEAGRQEGIEQGMEKGQYLKAREVAEKMLQAGSFSHQAIAELSGLSLAEVEALARPAKP